MTRFAEFDWHPRYDVASSQTVETIISVNGEKAPGTDALGLVSPTAKEPKLAPINARAETLSTSPMLREAFRRHRCLVVADGFYEWRKNEGLRRRLRSGRPFGLGYLVGRHATRFAIDHPMESRRRGLRPFATSLRSSHTS